MFSINILVSNFLYCEKNNIKTKTDNLDFPFYTNIVVQAEGGDQVKKEMYRLLIFNTVSSIVFTFVYLFVNLYIWQQNQSLADLAWFNVSQFTLWSISYFVGSYIFNKTTLRTVMKVSSIFAVLLFFLLSFCEFENPLVWIIFSGSIFGTMKGLHSSGSTQALGMLGEGKEYTIYFQQNDLWNKTVNIVMPLVFALLLVAFDYKILFIIMLFFSVIMLLISNYLPDLKPIELFGKVNIYRNFSLLKVFKKKEHNLLPLSYLSGGVFSEFQSIFLLFFTFTITSDKMWVAILNILYTLLALISIRLYKRINLKDETWLFIGIGFAFTGLALSTFLEDWWMIIPNVLLVFGNFYYRSTYFAQQFQAINNEKPLLKFQITIWREILLCLSRVILLSMILIFNKYMDVSNYLYWLMGIALFTSLCVPFIHRSFELENQAR